MRNNVATEEKIIKDVEINRAKSVGHDKISPNMLRIIENMGHLGKLE